jgi:hypothetical protein
MITNWEPTKTGKARAICQYCDRRTKPRDPQPDGRPAFWCEFAGWSVAPYPVDFEHPDGSHGSLYCCPDCRRLSDERQRAGIRPLLSPTPERAAARIARDSTAASFGVSPDYRRGEVKP